MKYFKPITPPTEFQLDEHYYADKEYATNSMLTKFSEKTPAHFKHSLTQPQKKTAAMDFGTKFHLFCLEPDVFDNRYSLYDETARPEPNKTFNSTLNKAWKKEYKEALASTGKEMLEPWEFHSVSNMKKSMLSVDKVNELLNFNSGKVEQVFAGEHIESGLSCKGKVDYIDESRGILVDLKTTQDASNRGFERTVIKHKYHKQAAFYLDLTGMETFYIIAVEKDAPHMINIFEFSEDLIAEGRELYRRELELLSYCKSSDDWFGYLKSKDQESNLLTSNILL